jgi:hypothetical protein
MKRSLFFASFAAIVHGSRTAARVLSDPRLSNQEHDNRFIPAYERPPSRSTTLPYTQVTIHSDPLGLAIKTKMNSDPSIGLAA